MTLTNALAGLVTPCLLLDQDKLDTNARRMRERCDDLGVRLRPHLKTAKSIEVAEIAKPGERACITVSTLIEADHFATHGFDDILYAVTITPNKFYRAADIIRRTHARLIVAVDSLEMATALSDFAATTGVDFHVAIEIDCGEHRSGLPADSPEIARIATLLEAGTATRCVGVMSHAGHSYATEDVAEIARLAERERLAAVTAADIARTAGATVDLVSVGSTPTALFATHLDGVTDVRCGIYMFWDLAQYSRRICALEDLALSVLATVVGHNRQSGAVILDAGALALSKDVSANTFLADAGFGYVCDAETTERLGTLSVAAVHQEHATVPIDSLAWFERLPIGSMVRVLPNHACLTAAGHDHYSVISDNNIVASWPRINGWA